jgi:hypothetical protein
MYHRIKHEEEKETLMLSAHQTQDPIEENAWKLLRLMVNQPNKEHFHGAELQEWSGIENDIDVNDAIEWLESSGAIEVIWARPAAATKSAFVTLKGRGKTMYRNRESGQEDKHPVTDTPLPINNVFNTAFHGSIGNLAMGSHDFSQQATVQQLWAQASGEYDLPTLAKELGQVRQAMATQASETEQLQDLTVATSAEIAAKKNDGPKMIEHLKDFSKWSLGVATTVGAGTLLALLKEHIGLK